MTDQIQPDDPDPRTVGPTADLTMDPDVQEALSRKYSNNLIGIMPLSSGKFALFRRDYSLHSIVDTLPTESELRTLSIEFQSALHYKSKMAEELRFYGEPDDRTLARDIRNQFSRSPKKPSAQPIDIEL